MTRNVSIGAPFAWLMKALDVGRRNPQALFGGFLLLLAVGLVPSLVQLAGDALLTPKSGGWIAVYALSVIVSLVLMPPLMGSAFRVVDASERGAPARATDIFDGYRDHGFWLRTVLLAIAFIAVYVVVLGALLAVLPARETVFEFLARAAATPPGGQPDLSGLSAPPGQLFLWLLGAMFLLLVLGNAYMLAFAQVSLGGRPILGALTDGFAGAFRNVVPFVAFAVAMFFIGLVALLIASILIGLVFAVLAMVSQALAIAVIVPLYLVLMLGIYVVMFGFYYHAWREIHGGGAIVDESTLAA